MVHRGSLNNVAVDVLGNVRVCFFELEFWKRKHVKCRAQELQPAAQCTQTFGQIRGNSHASPLPSRSNKGLYDRWCNLCPSEAPVSARVG